MPKTKEKPAPKAAAAPAPKGKRKKGQPAPPPPPRVREVVYPVVKAEVCVGEKAITVEKAKKLMGWTTEPVPGLEPLLIDKEGKKVWCVNNVINRPLYTSKVDELVQEHLNKRWVFNGEPIIIGKTEQVLNGQHTLVSLPLAEQLRTGKQKFHWEETWDGPVKMEKLIVYGVDETDDIVNTMDTCKPRTLADVLYRSPYFADLKPSDRRTASRSLDNAIRLLWLRTGAAADPFTRKRTHSEAVDFIARHPTLLKAVSYIQTENSEWKVVNTSRLSPGYASALLYLMAVSESDGDQYDNADPPSEKWLTLENWDKACEFWTLLAGANPGMQEVSYALAGLMDPETMTGGSLACKVAVIIKAWEVFKDGSEPAASDLQLEYQVDDDGIKHLINPPVFSGIDRGQAKPEKSTGSEGGGAELEVTVEEVAEAEEAADAAEAAEEEVEAPPPPKGKKGKKVAQAPATIPFTPAANGNGSSRADVYAQPSTPNRAPGEISPTEETQFDKSGKPPAPAVIKRPPVPRKK